MCQEEEQICPSLRHRGKLDNGGSQLLDRPNILNRCPLKPGEMVPTCMSQELGSRRDSEDHVVRPCPSGLERPRDKLFEVYSVPWGIDEWAGMSRKECEKNCPARMQGSDRILSRE